jgi:hypothetical protein
VPGSIRDGAGLTTTTVVRINDSAQGIEGRFIEVFINRKRGRQPARSGVNIAHGQLNYV